MFNTLVIWIIKTFLGKRFVMAVYEGGIQKVKLVNFTKDGKAYVHSEDGKVGFLDQVTNRAGEFRKNISDDNLIRWFDV